MPWYGWLASILAYLAVGSGWITVLWKEVTNENGIKNRSWLGKVRRILLFPDKYIKERFWKDWFLTSHTDYTGETTHDNQPDAFCLAEYLLCARARNEKFDAYGVVFINVLFWPIRLFPLVGGLFVLLALGLRELTRTLVFVAQSLTKPSGSSKLLDLQIEDLGLQLERFEKLRQGLSSKLEADTRFIGNWRKFLTAPEMSTDTDKEICESHIEILVTRKNNKEEAVSQIETAIKKIAAGQKRLLFLAEMLELGEKTKEYLSDSSANASEQDIRTEIEKVLTEVNVAVGVCQKFSEIEAKGITASSSDKKAKLLQIVK